jgi:RNA-dependent RNA polymerase
MTPKVQPPWANQESIYVQVRGIPAQWSTWDMYQMLSPHGDLARIEIFEHSRGGLRNGSLIFRPPPQSANWIYHGLKVETTDGKCHMMRFIVDTTKIDNKRPGSAPSEAVYVPATCLDVGVMEHEHTMLGLFTTTSNVAIVANRKFNELVIKFGACFPADSSDHDFKISIKLSQMRKVYRLQNPQGYVALVFSLDLPPLIWRKTKNIKATHDFDGKVGEWNDALAWERQTGIDNHPQPAEAIAQLQKEAAILDVGRWLTYRVIMPKAAVESEAFAELSKTLTDHNIALSSDIPIRYRQGSPSDPVLQLERLMRPELSVSDMQLMAAPSVHLEWVVRYQLEACISQGVLFEGNITHDFITRLAGMESSRATRLLEKAMDENKRYYDPVEVFKLQSLLVKAKKLPPYCAMVRSAVVTPTAIYFTTPTLETSNRVIREYRQHEGRFLRVKFSDEKWKGKIMAGGDNTMDEILARVKRTMKNGITIGGRHYDFLAFGNSQFREHGAYFFSPIGATTAETIRSWMGNFTKINVVAKYSARLGQCLSTTRPLGIRVSVEPIPDIERNGFCFTDGVGKTTPFVAQMIAAAFGLPNSTEDYPSVFQFRLGGCKGVLAVDPELKGQAVYIRPSQEKFPAKHFGLEICRISQYSTAYLNVQVISVLEALGVPQSVFLEKMKTALSDLSLALEDMTKATEQLCRNIDFNGTTLTLADMIYDGFMDAQDPFFVSCLRLWRAWMIKYLKEKARLFVNRGAFVLGCVDETATLKGHSNSVHFTKKNKADLPEIFLQVSDPEAPGKYRIVEGICTLARNPCLHPGDIRMVMAVDKPALHHLKNCVVLPQTGDRDLANMCSGGDLDGDDYLVMWDPDLIPQEWNHAPMDYQAPAPVRSNGPVTVDAITSFFVTHMRDDKLGQIAVQHRYWADRLPEGVKSDRCLDLASRHSTAVDFTKTGVPAELPRELQFKGPYPHWSEKKQTYKSGKTIGRLYDMVERVPFRPAWDLPFDDRILEAYDLSESMIQDALEVKQQYDDAARRIMNQYALKDDFQLWTTFAMEHDKDLNDYKFAEILGDKVTGLKHLAKGLCYEKAGTTSEKPDWDKLGPFIAAMYTATAREVQAAWNANNATQYVGGQIVKKHATFDNMPFMSFPWIFSRELGHIAKKRAPGSRPVVHVHAGVPQKAQQKKKNFDLLTNGVQLAPLPEVSTAEGVVYEGDLLDIHHKGEDDDSGTSGGEPRPSQGASSAGDSLLDRGPMDVQHRGEGGVREPQLVPDAKVAGGDLHERDLPDARHQGGNEFSETLTETKSNGSRDTHAHASNESARLAAIPVHTSTTRGPQENVFDISAPASTAGGTVQRTNVSKPREPDTPKVASSPEVDESGSNVQGQVDDYDADDESGGEAEVVVMQRGKTSALSALQRMLGV